MRKNIKRIICSIIVLLFIFTNANVAFAAEDDKKVMQTEMQVRKTHNAVLSNSSVNLSKYIPDVKAFEKDILAQLMVDDSNLTDAENYGYIDLRKYNLPTDVDLYTAICEHIFYESPELFRVTGISAVLGGKNESQIVGLKGAYIYDYPADFVKDYNAMVKKANEMLQGIEGNDNLNDVEKALLLHDRIASFCEYDVINLENDTLPDKAFNAYGVLGTGVAVCMGYALAYDYLLGRVGIESQYCSSDKLNHAWNIVYIDGKPYHVDITWDDVTNDVSGQVWHDNFLRSTDGIKETGHKYGMFNRTDFITTPQDTKYDNYFWQDSITAFQLVDDKIYYIDGDFSSEDGNQKTGKLTALDDINDTTPEVITEITDTWKKVEDNTTWKYNFSKLASGNGLLYYSTSTSVYSYNPKTNENKLVITPEEVSAEINDNSNVIYGLRFDGCTLSGEYANTPNYELTTKQENPFSRVIHSESDEWTVVVSSSKEKAKRLCENCDYVFEEKAVSALGNHNWGAWYNDPLNTPTCTENGKRISNCQDVDCTLKKIEYVRASGHNYSGEWTTDFAATCLDIGIESQHCTKCENRKNVTIIPVSSNHTPGNTWLIGEVATCKNAGYNYKVCVICGKETERQVVEQKSHKIVTINARTVTCTVNGYTGDKKCSSCGTILEMGTVTKAPGHKLSDWIIASYPTETSDGYKYRECTVCCEIVEGKDIKKVTTLSIPEVSTSASKKGITVTWNDIENAEHYIVYRRQYNPDKKKYSGWTVLDKACTGTSFLDTTVKLGVTYSYTVRAVNGDVKSKYVATKGLKYNVTPAVKVANASNGVKVSWSTAANATGYRVYRAELSSGKWSGWKNMGTTKSTTTSWVDKSVKSGKQYKYTVRAVNGKVLSAYKKTGSKVLFLAQPTVKIANNASGIKVGWNKISGAKGYTIYRQEIVNGKWTGWKNLGTIKNGSTVSWVDKSVKSGATYRYTVRAVNGNYKSTYKATSGLLYLSQPTPTVKAVSNGINVSWIQSTGASGYIVYRSELVDGKWTKWKNMGTAKADKTNWTDKSAKKGITYKYTVRAVNGSTKSTYVASGFVKR